MSYGSCKVIHYKQVKRFKVANAKKTWIRVLISAEDGAPNYAMRIFELMPGAHIFEHKHPWEHELFILKGKVKIKIGSKIYEVDEGTAIYIPPNIPHEYWNEGKKTVRFICTIPLKPTTSNN